VFGDAQGITTQGTIFEQSVMREGYGASIRSLSDDLCRPIELILGWCVPGPVFLARRKAYESDQIGKYNEELLVEDRDYYLRLICIDALGFVDARVARYRVHRTNQTRSENLHPSQHKKMLKVAFDADIASLGVFRGLKKFFLILNSQEILKRYLMIDCNISKLEELYFFISSGFLWRVSKRFYRGLALIRVFIK
jgi:hypothetical protein